jgi:transcriptional accessory protein Tex/SPT6
VTLTSIAGTNAEMQRAVVGMEDETAPFEEKKLLKHVPLLKECTLEHSKFVLFTEYYWGEVSHWRDL